MVTLQTNRLTLQPCSTDDRDDFIALERDPEVMRFLNGGQIVDVENPDPASPFLMPRGTEPYVWTARDNAGNAFVGWFCLWPETATLAELGYRLRRDCWGKGLASEGAAALVAWGFSAGCYDKIIATTIATNITSQRVMEKIGMTRSKSTFPEAMENVSTNEEGDVWFEILGNRLATRPSQ